MKNDDYEKGWGRGYDEAISDLKADIEALLTAPQTDDPIDLLQDIADTVGVEDYNYWQGRGQWVLYP